MSAILNDFTAILNAELTGKGCASLLAALEVDVWAYQHPFSIHAPRPYTGRCESFLKGKRYTL